MSDKEKIDVAPQPARPAEAPAAPVAGPKEAYNPALSEEAWNNGKNPWNASPQGRLAIRMVSRGVLGAAFFAVGGQMARKWMEEYNASKGFLEQKNPLTFISKLIDTVVAKPVEVTVRSYGKLAGMGVKEAELLGKQSVRFRPTANVGRWGDVAGRSLGHETSMVTFDFFCASIGDAWGRDIAGWIDPNVKKHWIKPDYDKDGNPAGGHIEWPLAIKQALKSTWRYVSYNGGEDWAVAIPYVYFMKGQRALVNHLSPGFAYDFDRNLNGGSYKLEGDKVVGNYSRAGIFDLQSRFMVYNMGTVAYRELYNHIGDVFNGKKSALYGAPDKPEVKNPVDKAANVAKWMVRSVVKGGIYMAPAVPFFWFTRTPQTKYRSGYIDKDKGILVTGTGDNPDHLLAQENALGAKAHFAHYDAQSGKITHASGVMDHVKNARGGVFKPYIDERGIINFSGRASNKAVRIVGEQAVKADNAFGPFGDAVKDRLGVKSFRGLSATYVNAAISYMPYMYAKAEFANLWDDGKMDMSIERAIDGAARFNFGEFKQGLREIGHSILHKPLPDARREAEAQRRIDLDDSAADAFTETKGEMHSKDELHKILADSKHAAAGSWRERLVAGKKEDRPEIGANNPKNYAEKEAMREALKDLQPPTNSIN